MLARFHKPKFIPLIFSLGGILTTLALGTWQIQRLIWKEGLIAATEQAATLDPLRELPTEGYKEKQFHKVRVSGHYLDDPQFHIAARYHKSQLGYHVITPFKTSNGTLVLVNRGWIPADQKQQSFAPPAGSREITGIIRVGADRNPFTPASQPERNIWFGRDVELMAREAKIDALPYMLDLVEQTPEKTYPIAFDGSIKLRNDHLSYVIIWYSLAAGILVIALVYHRKKPDET